MVIDDIQDYRQPGLMRGINETLQRLRPAVAVLHGVRIDGIITPVALARKLGHRHQLERRYAEAVTRIPSDQRPRALVAALSADGYAASVVDGAADHTVQICQHHCPVAHVAIEFPALCDAEAEAFGRLLGSHVTRLATIAHGDGVCTTLVSRPGSAVPTSTSAPHRATTEVLS
jgi:predicted ArsR family transcriptional regulator